EPAHARAVVRVAAEVGCAVVGPPGALLLRLAEDHGLRGYAEGFADRGYTATGALVPRTDPGAMLTDPDEVAARVTRLARTCTATRREPSPWPAGYEPRSRTPDSHPGRSHDRPGAAPQR